MAVQAPPDTPAPRLNPFVFPSDTDFRFVLLIVSVLGASLLLYSLIFESLPATGEYRRAQYQQCIELADPFSPASSLADRAERTLAYSQCTAAVDRTQALWMLGGLAVLAGVAAVIYWTYPLRKMRLNRLVPLSAEDAPEVVAYLAELCREAGLARPPTFFWNPLDQVPTGVVFGRFGRYSVAITGGMVRQFSRDRLAFRAVVLHELAHLRNADVDKTYLSVAVWEAFLVAGLAPFIASQFTSGRPLDEAIAYGWRVLPLAALVYLSRNAVLRAREVYADVRASVWDGPAGGLRRGLEALTGGRDQLLTRLWGAHPDPAERLRALSDTARLFRLGIWEALGTGMAAGIAFPNAVLLLHLLLPMPQAVLRPLGPALIFAPLAVGVVGMGVWRATFAAQVRGQTPRGAGRLGLGLGVGFLLGQQFSFAAVTIAAEEQALSGTAALVVEAVWGALLLACLFLFLRWIAAGASTWLEVAALGRSPSPVYRFGLLLAGGLLALWLGLLFLPYLALRGAGGALASPEIQAVLVGIQQELAAPAGAASSEGALPSVPANLMRTAGNALVLGNTVALLSVLVLCAFPLAAWFWRGRLASPPAPSWAFLDATSRPLRLPRQEPLRPGLAAAIGLVGGLVFCGLSLLIYQALFGARDDPEVVALVNSLDLGAGASFEDHWVLLVSAWIVVGQTALAVFVQAAVAAVTAGWIRRLSTLHALFAACVAACVMLAGAIGLAAAFDVLWDDPMLTGMIATPMLVGGGLLALPVGWSASLLARSIRGRAQPDSQSAPDDLPSRTPARG